MIITLKNYNNVHTCGYNYSLSSRSLSLLSFACIQMLGLQCGNVTIRLSCLAHTSEIPLNQTDFLRGFSLLTGISHS